MANYTSQYTGQTIDRALGKANSLCYAEVGSSMSVTVTGYEIAVDAARVVGVPLSLKFTTEVAASAKLTVNGVQKSIYFNGAAIAANTILAGSTVSLVYDGTNFVLVSGGPTARVNGTKLILG